MKTDWKGSTSLSTIGLDVVLSVLVGFFGGRWLDGRFGTAPWLGAVGLIVGVGAAVNAILRAYRTMKEATRREEAAEGNPRPIFGAGSLEDEAREAAAKRHAEDPSGAEQPPAADEPPAKGDDERS